MQPRRCGLIEAGLRWPPQCAPRFDRPGRGWCQRDHPSENPGAIGGGRGLHSRKTSKPPRYCRRGNVGMTTITTVHTDHSATRPRATTEENGRGTLQRPQTLDLSSSKNGSTPRSDFTFLPVARKPGSRSVFHYCASLQPSAKNHSTTLASIRRKCLFECLFGT